MLAIFRPSARDWFLAKKDLLGGLAAWEMWGLLGASDIRQRYKRSKLGQLWITLSLGLFVGSIGTVYSLLFGQPMHQYLPYIAINIVIWTFISGIITDGTSAFVQAGIYMRQDAMPKTIFVMRVIVRNLIILLHNAVIIPIVMIILWSGTNYNIVFVLPGFALLIIASFGAALACGVISTRFRDLPQTIQSLLQIVFFVTPIMWQPGQMSHHGRILVDLNPFAAFLEIVADPVRGVAPSMWAYGNAIISTVVIYAIAIPLFTRFRARLVYWL